MQKITAWEKRRIKEQGEEDAKEEAKALDLERANIGRMAVLNAVDAIRAAEEPAAQFLRVRQKEENITFFLSGYMMAKHEEGKGGDIYLEALKALKKFEADRGE